MKRNILFAASLLALQSVATLAWGNEITITDAYMRVSGSMATSAAAFMQITNHGDSDDRLIAASTEASAKAELHSHTEDANGVMVMGEIEGGIALPGHSGHALARSGDHVMLMGLTAPLVDGDKIVLTLRFEKAGEIAVEVPVDNQRKPEAAAMDHGKMDHSKMGHGKMGQGASN